MFDQNSANSTADLIKAIDSDMINQTTRQFLKFLAEELEKQSSLDEVCDINIAFEYEFQAMIILFKLVVYTFY
jgi:hypothetical protein